MIHFHRLRVEVRSPSARSERIVAPCGSVLERFFVQFAVVAKRFFALRDKIMNHPFYFRIIGPWRQFMEGVVESDLAPK